MAFQGRQWKCLGNTKQTNCVVSEQILLKRDLITTASWDHDAKDQLSRIILKLEVVNWISLAKSVLQYTVYLLYDTVYYIPDNYGKRKEREQFKSEMSMAPVGWNLWKWLQSLIIICRSPSVIAYSFNRNLHNSLHKLSSLKCLALLHT